MRPAGSFTDFIEFEHSDDGVGGGSEEETLLFAGGGGRGPGGPSSAPHAAERRGLLGALGQIWRPGSDAESSRVNHHFTNEAVYRKWLARQVIDALAEFKYGVTRWLLLHTDLGVAWLFNTLLSLCLVAGSSALVVRAAPAAVSSGVPEVMAYLNGVLLPKVFNIFTVAVKFASCALAVASGLPVGPEGPMIHIGAALGAALSQGHSTTLGFTTAAFRRFRNPRDKRDFVTAGVAVGVATAFNAPIGGLLFAFEEIFFACMCATLTLNLSRSAGKAIFHSGSFGWFNQEVAFEAGLEISAHILAVVPAAVVGLLCGGLGVGFTLLNLKIARLRDAIALPANAWRRCVEPCVLVVLYVTGTMLLPRLFPCTPTHCVAYDHAVYCGLGNVTAAAGGAAPPPDTPPLSLPLYTCAAGRAENGTWVPSTGTITPDSPSNASAVVFYNELATLMLNTGAPARWMRRPGAGCGAPRRAAWCRRPALGHGPLARARAAAATPRPAASPPRRRPARRAGDETIKHLLSRGAHRRFGYASLGVMLAWYFVGAALSAGSAIASGLFVPMLMMGALTGRLVGLATTDIADKYGQLLSSWTTAGTASNPWSWIDPGAFALVGAGAFMSSVTRLTVSLAVIMVEISDDVHMLLPVLVAIMVAKWVADAACHSLYHALLEVKAVPFLDHEPVSRFSLELLPVSATMRAPVVSLELTMKVSDIQAILRDTSHNGYPVVRDSSAGQICLGLVTRAHLLVLLQRLIDGYNPTTGSPAPSGAGGAGGGGAAGGARGGAGGATAPGGAADTPAQQHQQPLLARELSWQDLNRKMMEPVEASELERRGGAAEQQMVALPGAADWELDLAPGLLAQTVDLTPYVNTSVMKVSESMSLERAYIIFRTMGLRHLIVVDAHNRVRGIVTRKDLLGFKLDEAVARALRRVDSARQLGQAAWLGGASPAGGVGGGAAGGSGGIVGAGARWGDEMPGSAASTISDDSDDSDDRLERVAFKLVLLGDAGVGKTALARRLAADVAPPDAGTAPTSGVEFYAAELRLTEDTTATLQVWDLGAAGVGSLAMAANYLAGCDGVLLVHDVAAPNSFAAACAWLGLLREMFAPAGALPYVGVVANKADAEPQRAAAARLHAGAAELSDAFTYCVSAATGAGVAAMFIQAAADLAGIPLTPAQLAAAVARRAPAPADDDRPPPLAAAPAAPAAPRGRAPRRARMAAPRRRLALAPPPPQRPKPQAHDDGGVADARPGHGGAAEPVGWAAAAWGAAHALPPLAGEPVAPHGVHAAADGGGRGGGGYAPPRPLSPASAQAALAAAAAEVRAVFAAGGPALLEWVTAAPDVQDAEHLRRAAQALAAYVAAEAAPGGAAHADAHGAHALLQGLAARPAPCMSVLELTGVCRPLLAVATYSPHTALRGLAAELVDRWARIALAAARRAEAALAAQRRAGAGRGGGALPELAGVAVCQRRCRRNSALLPPAAPMAEARPKRRSVLRKNALPDATHYVGYVEDEETPEMIMKKFEEMERIRAAPAARAASPGDGQEPAERGAGAAGPSVGGGGGTAGGGGAGDAGAGPLDQAQLMQVFKATSMYNVKSVLSNNAALMADARSQDRGPASDAAFDSGSEDDLVAELRGFWSDDDWGGRASKKRSKGARGAARDGGARGRGGGRGGGGALQRNARTAMIAQYNRDTHAFIRRRVRVADPDALLQLRVPPPPLPLAWGRAVRPAGQRAVAGAAAGGGAAAAAQQQAPAAARGLLHQWHTLPASRNCDPTSDGGGSSSQGAGARRAAPRRSASAHAARPRRPPVPPGAAGGTPPGDACARHVAHDIPGFAFGSLAVSEFQAVLINTGWELRPQAAADQQQLDQQPQGQQAQAQQQQQQQAQQQQGGVASWAPAAAPDLPAISGGGAGGGGGLPEAVQRLACVPVPALCPRGFIFIWANKEHLSGARRSARAQHAPRPPHSPHVRARPAARPTSRRAARAAVVRLMSAWGFSYVENLTWVLLGPGHDVLRLPYPTARRSHVTLYIFRKDGEGRDIELRHQRSPDVVLDCVRAVEGREWDVPAEVFATIETLLPTGQGAFLELWAPAEAGRAGWTHVVERPASRSSSGFGGSSSGGACAEPAAAQPLAREWQSSAERTSRPAERRPGALGSPCTLLALCSPAARAGMADPGSPKRPRPEEATAALKRPRGEPAGGDGSNQQLAAPPPPGEPLDAGNLLPALQQLLAVYKVEYWALLEEMRAKRQAFCAAGRDAGGAGDDAEAAGAPAPGAGGVRELLLGAGQQQQGDAAPGGGYGDARCGHGAAAERLPPPSEAEAALLALPRGADGGAASAEQLAAWHARFVGASGGVAALEQLASAATAQLLDAQGGLACLCGAGGRWVLRRTAVTVGRSSDSKGDVDVDLGKAAGGVSRLQAQLSLGLDGGWSVRNTGRAPLAVNGRHVPRGGCAALPHLSLLDVGGVALLFMANSMATARAIDRSTHLVM
ncbi:clcD [Scenedesmus sp. PABB004]|nr:clcD [Scenedesmus sp. PABB004]